MRIFFTIILLGITICAKSQINQNHDNHDHHDHHDHHAVTQSEYVDIYQNIKGGMNDGMKLSRAKNCLGHSYFTSVQVKTLLEIFVTERARLEFAKAAYFKTVDPQNYYDVYDKFAYFSTAFRLYDFVSRQGDQAHEGYSVNVGYTYSFPNFQYPNSAEYRDECNCEFPVSDQEFLALLSNIKENELYDNNVRRALAIVANNCLSVAQFMKMASVIKNPNGAYAFLTKGAKNAYDKHNYNLSIQVFRGKQPFHNDFLMFLASLNKPEPVPVLPPVDQPVSAPPTDPEPVQCFVSDHDFDDIITSVQQKTFDNTKLTIIKQIIKAKGCFSALQIKRLVELLSFESGKLEIAKYAYPYCTDQNNYFKVSDAFDFESSIKNLNNFISQQ